VLNTPFNENKTNNGGIFMCKYCKMKPGIPGEWTNESRDIGSIKEGRILFVAMLNRYVTEDDDYHLGELILSHEVMLSDGMHDVQQKHIPIKYCPFCGEKL
jgi:hypothetical protein